MKNLSRYCRSLIAAGAALSIAAACSSVDSGTMNEVSDEGASDVSGVAEAETEVAEAEDGADTEPTVAAETTTIAEVTTDDGVTYSFFSAENGDVGAIVKADFAVDASRLPNAESSLSEFYEQIAGEAAPEALVDAERRALELAAEEAPEPVLPDGTSFDAEQLPENAAEGGEFASVSEALTVAQFQSMYCPSGYDFLWCLPNWSGNPWVQLNSYYLAGAMNATNCTTRFRYRYFSGGNWLTLVDAQATPGQHFWYYTFGGTTHRRWEILDNAGCGVRFSVWGWY